jgi:hypothetical protein
MGAYPVAQGGDFAVMRGLGAISLVSGDFGEPVNGLENVELPWITAAIRCVAGSMYRDLD